MSRARDLGSLINSTAAGKNLVINGGFDIWQRGTSFNNAGNETFHADRWFLVNDGVSTVNISRVDISSQGLGVRYASRVERSAGNNRTVYIHIAEGALDLVGKQVTLSFYIRKGSGLTDNIGIAFGTRTGRYSAEADSAGFTVANSSLNTSTFTRFSRTLNITSATSTAGANVFELEFSFWQAGAANAYFEITGVQLEVGSVPTPFSKAGGDIQGELAKCQRYYQRLQSSFSYLQIVCTHLPGYSNSYSQAIEFPVQMRANPSITVADINGTANRITGYLSGGPVNNLSPTIQVSPLGFRVLTSGEYRYFELINVEAVSEI